MNTHSRTPWRLERLNEASVEIVSDDGWLVDIQDLESARRGLPKQTADEVVRRAGEDYLRKVAAVNFFHGRDIPTERIPESGFWKMADLLGLTLRYVEVLDRPWAPELKENIRALLTKLGVEP